MNNKSVLICEDDEGIIDIAQIVLSDKGYSVICLVNSYNIYSVIEAKKPDLLILDLWISGTSGEEITRTLKADSTKKHIPVIIMSAHKNGPAIAREAGAEGFLRKPFDINELEEIVEQFL
ncbi:MAG: response regulator [Chloroflexi bacterium]|nr:response regulator [Chloroflexota bacterium]OJV95876.1 MAG: hypothetical protein BGO39_21455 [Chloroflexi bacterium 54-19]